MKKFLVPVAAAAFSLVVAGCGSAPGATGSGDASEAEQEAADVLGISLEDCPTDITEELGDTAKIGQTLPLSGPVAVLSVIKDGEEAGFGHFNSTLDLPTTFEYLPKDDQFDPAKTATAAQELIQKEGVVALNGVVGTANVHSIIGTAVDSCVPLIGAQSGGSSVIEADEAMMTTTLAMPFKTESRAWVERINETYPDGATIALFTANSESGKDYATNFKAQLESTDSASEIVAEESIEPVDTGAPSSQVTTLRNSDADVLVMGLTTSQCAPALVEVANQGWKPDILLTGTCGGAAYLEPAGAAADGVQVLLFTKDPASDRWKDDEGVKDFLAALDEYAPNAQLQVTTLTGYLSAEMLFKAAEAAAESELGLSPLGLAYAARHLDYQPSLHFPGVKVKLDGADDIYAIEAGELNEWDADKSDFEPIKMYDFEGEMTE
jgi:branched-chain amino acid transport system substrate-binding protein